MGNDALTPRGTGSTESVPALPSELIDRSALLTRLDEIGRHALTMVTGPAGSGKTTVVAQWCQQRCKLPVAWIDSATAGVQPHRLLETAIAASGGATGRSVDDDTARWFSPGDARLDAQAPDQLARLLVAAPDAVIVVDGLTPTSPISLYADVGRAIERAEGCGLHLVTVSRGAPPVELTQMLLRRSAMHIDRAALQLSAEHVAAVVEAYGGHPLDPTTTQALTKRLGGWMAGAVLVGLSHPGVDGLSADDLFAAAFDRIDAYVHSDILTDVPEELHDFIVSTACVEELSPALCDAITGRTDSNRVLRLLAGTGLPLARGAVRTGSYRWQAPVREVLDARAQRDDPIARNAALATAAEWYGTHQRPLEAARSWIQLNEWGQALNVVLRNLQRVLEQDAFGELAELVEAVPDEHLRAHQNLTAACAWVLRMDGRVAAAQEMLSVYRASMTPVGQMIADVGLASTASWGDDMAGLVSFAESAVVTCDELGDDYFAGYGGEYTEASIDNFRAMARGAALLASAYGDLWERGSRHLVEIRAETLVSLPKIHVVQIRGWRATFQVFAGDVASAMVEAREALRVATDCRLDTGRAAADALYALGEAQRLTSQRDGTGELFERSRQLAEINGRRNLIASIVGSQAHLHVDIGDADRALALLDQHEGQQPNLPRSVAGHLAAARARALGATGTHALALRCLQLVEPTAATAMCQVTVALSTGDVRLARDTIERWPQQPTTNSIVRRALAVAVVADAAGDSKRAQAAFASALGVASDHQLIQPFIEIGTLVARMLRRAANERLHSVEATLARHVQEILINRDALTGVVSRLTAREELVLTHLAAGHSTPEIAAQISLSVNTVRTYVKAIYRKLGVNTRQDAVAAWQAIRTSS